MSLQCPSLFADHASDLCRAVDHYCERTGPELDAELVNAFTNVAQTLLPDERYTLEALAGRLLERGLPPPERNGSLPRSRERLADTLFDGELLAA